MCRARENSGKRLKMLLQVLVGLNDLWQGSSWCTGRGLDHPRSNQVVDYRHGLGSGCNVCLLGYRALLLKVLSSRDLIVGKEEHQKRGILTSSYTLTYL